MWISRLKFWVTPIHYLMLPMVWSYKKLYFLSFCYFFTLLFNIIFNINLLYTLFFQCSFFYFVCIFLYKIYVILNFALIMLTSIFFPCPITTKFVLLCLTFERNVKPILVNFFVCSYTNAVAYTTNLY